MVIGDKFNGFGTSMNKYLTILPLCAAMMMPMAGFAQTATTETTDTAAPKATETAPAASDAPAASGVEAEAHTPEGDPVERLIAAAADHRADAVLVGARGNTRLDRVRLGRVATGVAERSPLTVEVVRAG